MVKCALRPSVISVCKIFHINDESKLLVDIISEEGKIWTKGVYYLCYLHIFISIKYDTNALFLNLSFRLLSLYECSQS